MLKKIKIGVFRGGVSAEREISLESGEAVLKALLELGYNAVDCIIDSCDPLYIKEIVSDNSLDLVFIALHGEFGEDGQLQSILEQIDVCYTGSGPSASYDAMNKLRTHEILEHRGIVMPSYQMLVEGQDYNLLAVDFPCIVKPYLGGSSFGIRIVNSIEQLSEACSKALEFSDKIIIEEYIAGREFTVGVIDGEVLPVVEIKVATEFYDYQSKYQDERTQFIVPAQLAEEVTKELQTISLNVFDALGCKGAARIDIMLDVKSRPYVLELNSIPGMTSHSLLPLAATKNGLSFNDLCEKITRLSYI